MELYWENGDPITTENLEKRDQICNALAVTIMRAIHDAPPLPGGGTPWWALVKALTVCLALNAIEKEDEADDVGQAFLEFLGSYLPGAIPETMRILRGGKPRPVMDE